MQLTNIPSNVGPQERLFKKVDPNNLNRFQGTLSIPGGRFFSFFGRNWEVDRVDTTPEFANLTCFFQNQQTSVNWDIRYPFISSKAWRGGSLARPRGWTSSASRWVGVEWWLIFSVVSRVKKCNKRLVQWSKTKSQESFWMKRPVCYRPPEKKFL